MKNFLPIALLCCLLAACSLNDSDRENKQGSETTSQKKNISKRDRSINASNSYSDLFFDSTAMEQFIQKKKIDDSIANRIRSFYNTRNYQYAWFSGDGLTEQARAFWNLHDYITTYDPDSSLKDKTLQRKMDNLIAEDQLSVSPGDKSYLNTELTLTQHFIQYILHNYAKGFVKRKEMERFIPVKKVDALQLADSILNKKHKDDKYFEDVNPAYSSLKDQLDKYVDIAKKGGWPQINITKKRLKKGVTSPEIANIKRRLQITGDLEGNDSSAVFDDTLVNAIKNFQERHGYTPSGAISDSLIKEMNVPVAKRIQQIMMNMERMRWMASRQNGNLIVVNIPEFVLHVYEGDKKAFDMDVVVGKEGHNTTMFNGDLNQVVFCPYWNVPQSIVKKEILPEMDKDKNYLEKEDMEITGEEDGVPVIRQVPGSKNALGKVKFLFPNSFNIYFHDTPAKSLFEKDKRAYSHGCIRLKEPEKMANYVLSDQPEWTPERIEEAMNAGKEKFVKVKHPIPVLITYYTTWVDDKGQLNFREDIYGHDSDLAAKMFL
ncbi:MAG TPA: L,D-transpeptidase family protein [Chitinophagaceae bacterium]|nr:L,D-transpeptidase family protein [Chitinophagaceae bacterium]